MEILTKILLIGPVLLLSVIAHEIAHGYAALRQGDPTALMLGRLSWNPIRHIDPFLTILLPAMLLLIGGPVIGGAKPVPVNPRNYRQYKRGDIIVSLAGVATNFVIALGAAAVFFLAGVLGAASPAVAPMMGTLQAMMVIAVWLNFLLIVFNLIPIPPLDGSHVVKYLLPPAWSVQYQELGRRFGFFLLIALVWLGGGLFLRLLAPAFWASALLLGLVEPWGLPETVRWLEFVR